MNKKSELFKEANEIIDRYADWSNDYDVIEAEELLEDAINLICGFVDKEVKRKTWLKRLIYKLKAVWLTAPKPLREKTIGA